MKEKDSELRINALKFQGSRHFFSKKEKACKQAGKQVNVSPGYSKEKEKRSPPGLL